MPQDSEVLKYLNDLNDQGTERPGVANMAPLQEDRADQQRRIFCYPLFRDFFPFFRVSPILVKGIQTFLDELSPTFAFLGKK